MKIAAVENGSGFVRPLLAGMAEAYRMMPQECAEDPVEVFKRQCYVHPFHEENIGELVGADRRRPRAVRLRLPPPRGPRRSARLRATTSRACPTTTSSKIMGGNLAGLMGITVNA